MWDFVKNFLRGPRSGKRLVALRRRANRLALATETPRPMGLGQWMRPPLFFPFSRRQTGSRERSRRDLYRAKRRYTVDIAKTFSHSGGHKLKCRSGKSIHSSSGIHATTWGVGTRFATSMHQRR